MKKLALSCVLLGQAIVADTVGTKIPCVSVDNVHLFKQELKAAEQKRDTLFKVGVATVGAAVIGGIIWKSRNNYALYQQHYAEAIANLPENVRKINEFEQQQVRELEAAREEQKIEDHLSTGEWLSSIPGYLWSLPGAAAGAVGRGVKATPDVIVDGVRATPYAIGSVIGNTWRYSKNLVMRTAKKAYKKAPGWLAYLGIGYFTKEAGQFILPKLPSIGSYFLTLKSMKWCLVEHSDFYNVMVNFKNWIGYEAAHGYNSNDTQEVSLCMRHLVLEMERILGYMFFAMEHITPKITGYKFYQDRAERCIATIETETNTLAAEVQALSRARANPEQMKAFVDRLRRRLFTIISQLEGFEAVTSVVDLSSPYEEDIFGALKRFIYPEWQLERPQVQNPHHSMFDEFLEQLEKEVSPE